MSSDTIYRLWQAPRYNGIDADTVDQLYERVREARQLANLTQEALGLELGVSRGAVSQWEVPRGTSPSVQNLIALAQRSGMAFEYLFTGRGPKVLGAPAVAEQRPRYNAPSRQQKQLLAYFDSLTPGRRSALLDFLSRFTVT